MSKTCRSIYKTLHWK